MHFDVSRCSAGSVDAHVAHEGGALVGGSSAAISDSARTAICTN